MNFPGLDLSWSAVHRAGHALGFIRPWSLSETRAAVDRGEKVLVVATTALGDSLLTTPLVETLAHHLGRDRVALLVKSSCAELYRDDPRVHRVFTVRGKFRWEDLRTELQTDPHRLALLCNITEPDLIPYLWQCGVRGFLRYRSRWTRFPRWIANAEMLRRPSQPDYATGHAIENNLAMAEALGLESTTHCLALPQLAVKTEKRTRLVLIHPGASRENKRWPVENWARLADEIAGRFDCAVSLTGSRNEKELAGHVMQKMKSPASNVAGLLSLTALARMQAEAMAFISGDTGPYHLAVAVGCPTVTIFAPIDRGSSVEACGPHQADPTFHRAIQTAHLGEPVSSVSFERVWNEVQALLAAGPPPC